MPLSTELPVGDLYEFVGNFRLNGDGPPTTGRMGLARLQEIMLASTSLVGARIVSLEGRMASAEVQTAKVDGIGSRVTTLEGLAGITPGTDLGADGIAVRSTRYWGRPGEAIRTWTSVANATAQAATPLTVGGAYSITTDGPGKGPALRITGNAYATSIAKTHLDDGEIVEFTFRIARRVDNTGTNAAANNVPVLEFRSYKPDGTDNGTAALPSTTLLAADGLRTVTYRACLTPGVGSVDLPANTRFISPLFGERGTGAVELTSCDRSTQSLSSAPEMTDAIAAEDRFFIFDDSAKLIKKLSPLTLVQYLEARVTEPFIPWNGDADVGTSAVVLIPADPARNSVDILNSSAANTLLLGFGAEPVRGAKHTRVLPPGVGYVRRYPRTTAIYARAEAGICPVGVDFTNRSGNDVLKYALVDVYIAKSAYGPTTGERDVMATFLSRLRDSGALSVMSGGALLGGPNRSLALQDLIRNVTWAQVAPNGPITFTKYKGFTGNATDQCLKPGYIPAKDTAKFTLNNHGFGAYVDTSLASPNTSSVMGSYLTGLAPNRSTTSAGARSGFSSNDVINVDDRGGYHGVSRTSSDKYRYTRGATAQDVATLSTSLGSNDYEMIVLAQTNAQNAVLGYSNLTPFFVWFGSAATDAIHQAINAACAEAIAGFAALPA